jgi:hypothetical protein
MSTAVFRRINERVEFVRDLVQEGIRQAMQFEAWLAIIITPVVLTLILRRVW